MKRLLVVGLPLSANDLATHSTGDEGAMCTFVSTCDISELLYLVKDARTFYWFLRLSELQEIFEAQEYLKYNLGPSPSI